MKTLCIAQYVCVHVCGCIRVCLGSDVCVCVCVRIRACKCAVRDLFPFHVVKNKINK